MAAASAACRPPPKVAHAQRLGGGLSRPPSPPSPASPWRCRRDAPAAAAAAADAAAALAEGRRRRAPRNRPASRQSLSRRPRRPRRSRPLRSAPPLTCMKRRHTSAQSPDDGRAGPPRRGARASELHTHARRRFTPSRPTPHRSKSRASAGTAPCRGLGEAVEPLDVLQPARPRTRYNAIGAAGATAIDRPAPSAADAAAARHPVPLVGCAGPRAIAALLPQGSDAGAGRSARAARPRGASHVSVRAPQARADAGAGLERDRRASAPPRAPHLPQALQELGLCGNAITLIGLLLCRVDHLPHHSFRIFWKSTARVLWVAGSFCHRAAPAPSAAGPVPGQQRDRRCRRLRRPHPARSAADAVPGLLGSALRVLARAGLPQALQTLYLGGMSRLGAAPPPPLAPHLSQALQTLDLIDNADRRRRAPPARGLFRNAGPEPAQQRDRRCGCSGDPPHASDADGGPGRQRACAALRRCARLRARAARAWTPLHRADSALRRGRAGPRTPSSTTPPSSRTLQNQP